MSLLQSILSLLGVISGIVAVLLTRRNDAAARRESAIAQAQREIADALAHKHFEDAAFWARRLRELSAVPLQPSPPAQPAPPTLPIILLCLLGHDGCNVL